MNLTVIFILLSRCIKLTCNMKSFRLKVAILMYGIVNEVVGNVRFFTPHKNKSILEGKKTQPKKKNDTNLQASAQN